MTSIPYETFKIRTAVVYFYHQTGNLQHISRCKNTFFACFFPLVLTKIRKMLQKMCKKEEKIYSQTLVHTQMLVLLIVKIVKNTFSPVFNIFFYVGPLLVGSLFLSASKLYIRGETDSRAF